MIEKVITKYLSDTLTVPVYMGERPSTDTSEYVVLQIIDNGRVNYIDTVTFNITSHSTTMQKAAELNQRVKEAMYNATTLNEVSSSKCGGGGQSIDTATKSYEYECIFNLYYYDD